MKTHKNNQQENISRLKWACRRGMLELDILLTNFVDNIYPTLSSTEQTLFKEQLLTLPDPILFNWLLGKDIPEEATLADLVNKIRTHATAKF